MKLQDVLNRQLTIVGAGEPQWDIWRNKVISLDLGHEGFDGWSGTVMFDRYTQDVWSLEYFPGNGTNPLRWMPTNMRDGYVQESVRRGVDPDQAFDDTRFVDVDDPNHILDLMVNEEKEDAGESEEVV